MYQQKNNNRVWSHLATVIGVGACVGGFLTACIDAGDMTIRLITATGDAPYAGVSQFEVAVLDATASVAARPLVQLTQPASAGAQLSLGETIPFEGVRLRVRGLNGAQVVAEGLSQVMALSTQPSQSVYVPFSTPSYIAVMTATLAHRGAPSIDGNLVDWQRSPALILDASALVTGPAVEPSDLWAEMYWAWRADALYFALRVFDDCPALVAGQPAGNCGPSATVDRVAMGFDNDAQGQAYGPHDYWLEVANGRITPKVGSGLRSEHLAFTFSILPDRNGWVLEGLFRPGAFGKTAYTATDQLGFDVMIYDEDPGQTNPTLLRWSRSGGTSTTPTTPPQMGTLGFSARE